LIANRSSNTIAFHPIPNRGLPKDFFDIRSIRKFHLNMKSLQDEKLIDG
jgi:hypothetical protein